MSDRPLSPDPAKRDGVPNAAGPSPSGAPPAVEHARDVDEVLAIVRRARATGRALYPVSTGLNWGYGSRSAPVPGCTLVDLSAMRRIRNADRISLSRPVAVIEPGVTQRQMAEFLEQNCPDLTFNPTGSSADTSILGNALDRGVGYFGPRVDDIFGLEVVTGSAELICTGFRRLGESSPLAHAHPHGLGPSLDGLFFQGNFGIVTSACLRLVPRRQRHVAVSMSLRREGDLAPFVDALALLKRDGVLTSVAHIGNAARTRSTLTARLVHYYEERCGYPQARARAEAASALPLVVAGEWTAMAALAGSAGQIRAALSEIKARLSGIVRVRTVSDGLLEAGYLVAHGLRAFPPARRIAAAAFAVSPLHGLVHGRPTDVAVDNLLWQFEAGHLPAARLDDSDCALLYVNPALPMDGAFIAQFVERMRSEAARFGFDLPVTVNIETAMSAVAVANLVYDRSEPAQVENARRCAASLYGLIRSEGLEVYRARVDMMSDVVDPLSPYWQIVRRLKSALDPDNIIAPGRYNLSD